MGRFWSSSGAGYAHWRDSVDTALADVNCPAPSHPAARFGGYRVCVAGGTTRWSLANGGEKDCANPIGPNAVGGLCEADGKTPRRVRGFQRTATPTAPSHSLTIEIS